jgi:hypothetical protein
MHEIRHVQVSMKLRAENQERGIPAIINNSRLVDTNSEF